MGTVDRLASFTAEVEEMERHDVRDRTNRPKERLRWDARIYIHARLPLPLPDNPPLGIHDN
jgi:hypothetical protein